MSTRDQIRASKAHQYITAHKSKEEKWRKEYTNMARGTSALIHASGLAQALEFIATRGNVLMGFRGADLISSRHDWFTLLSQSDGINHVRHWLCLQIEWFCSEFFL